MRFASLGSGSRGNGTLIEDGDTCVLLDCGFSVREAERRLERLGKTPDQLTALVVTHEHSDHISGVGALCRKYALPVWMTRGTWMQHNNGDIPDLNLFSHHELFEINGLQVEPFPVPHDAREPAQFVFTNGARRLGILTDTGHATGHIEKMLTTCDALMLECNHDPEMLAQGNYPQSLKDRVSGKLGHLSNDQAAEILAAIDYSRLQHIVAVHLSEMNNQPSLARWALASAIDCATDWIGVADQALGLQWRDIN